MDRDGHDRDGETGGGGTIGPRTGDTGGVGTIGVTRAGAEQAQTQAEQAEDHAEQARDRAKEAREQAEEARDHARRAETRLGAEEPEADGGGGWKKWAIIGGVGTLVVLLLIGWGLFVLGDDDQSALERLRDIAIIFVVLLFALVVVILAGIAAALGFLVLQIKDRVIPLLEELNGTLRRFRGTAEFVTEEAVKPILSVASTYAKMRAMTRTVMGKDGKGRRR